MIFTLYISRILVLKRNYWQSQGFPTWDEPHFLPLPGNICKKVYNRHSEGGWEISIHWEIKWINTATNMTSTCLYILALGKSNGGHFWKGGIGFFGLNGPGVTVTNSTDFFFFSKYFFVLFFWSIMIGLTKGNILFAAGGVSNLALKRLAKGLQLESRRQTDRKARPD